MNAGAIPLPPPQSLSAESLRMLAEGISLVLARWTGLQMAVQNEWGGRDSKQKAEGLSASILSWFSEPKDVLYIDDLEAMLDEQMVGSFNAEIDDGSVEEVAEELMLLHEECLQGKYESIEKLRKSIPRTSAISQSRQVINENDDESSDDEESDMMVDDPKWESTSSISHKQQASVDGEGWSIVAPRKNRGRRSS